MSLSAYDRVILADRPVLYLPLDDGSGTTATALAGSDGTYSGSPTLGVSGPTPVGSEGIATDGVDDICIVDPASEVPESPPLTVEMWLKWTATGLMTPGGVRDGGNSEEGCLVIANFSTAGQLSIYRAGSQRANFSGSYNDGSWHHVVAVVASTSATELFVDGSSVATAGAGTTTESASWAVVGSNRSDSATDGLQFFNGSIAAFAVYDYVLTADQIAQHYAASPPLPRTLIPHRRRL